MVLFGPSGCETEFYEKGYKSIFDAPEYLNSLGLDAFEYSFGHGYQMGFAQAEKVGQLFEQHNIKMSIHAPFYINFANPNEEMFAKTIGYLETGIKFLRAFKADKLVFHSASCGKETREAAIHLTKERFKQTFDMFDENGLMENIFLCPETMGKSMQIGTYKEVIDLCTINSHLVPTFDFGHINSLEQGSLKSKEDFKRILDYSIEKLGFEKTNNSHIHFSKIQYGPKGEIRHLNYDDVLYGPEFDGLAEVLIDYKLSPRVICESMNKMAHDALIMKKIYLNKLDKIN